MGIQDVCFQKNRRLTVGEMTRSSWVYKRLRDFVLGLWWDEDTDLEFVRLYRLLKP